MARHREAGEKRRSRQLQQQKENFSLALARVLEFVRPLNGFLAGSYDRSHTLARMQQRTHTQTVT